MTGPRHLWNQPCLRRLGSWFAGSRRADGSFEMFDKELKLNRRRDLREGTLEGETVILDRTNGQIHHLNATASFVWRHGDGLSSKAIAERLAQAFQIDPISAETDVVGLLGELKTMNLLETSDKSDL